MYHCIQLTEYSSKDFDKLVQVKPVIIFSFRTHYVTIGTSRWNHLLAKHFLTSFQLKVTFRWLSARKSQKDCPKISIRFTWCTLSYKPSEAPLIHIFFFQSKCSVLAERSPVSPAADAVMSPLTFTSAQSISSTIFSIWFTKRSYNR